MNKSTLCLALALLLHGGVPFAQDTFSIVAVDSLTGEVGSAGASCISAVNLQTFFPDFAPDFLGDLLPGRGAINTQSFYLLQNQLNARARLAEGLSPQGVLDWLVANDAQGNSTQRQYGVAAFQNGAPAAAAFTGVNCFDVKGHRVGPNYSIQGNILLGQGILDSMEARFLSAEGCLANKLMAAMQGAKVPGADTRCLSNGTSSMFAFIKVAAPGDSPAEPYLRLFVSYNPVGIEPIDSLQALFDANYICLSSLENARHTLSFSVSPNPASGEVRVTFPDDLGLLRVDVFDAQGILLDTHLNIASGTRLRIQQRGLVHLRLTDKEGRTGVKKVICAD
ncbi:MAG: DUF1028 domain-containing protein [Saprospiraceae bacterium]|nr:DUF1028 domain-containing protein [Saprospiraceae bacterium]